jgi:hypothetical protein
MTDEAIYVALQGAVERSKGAASWSDIAIAITAAKEKKVREQLLAIVGDYPLDDLLKALDIAHREMFKPVKASPTLSTTLDATAAADQPLVPANKRSKRKQ